MYFVKFWLILLNMFVRFICTHFLQFIYSYSQTVFHFVGTKMFVFWLMGNQLVFQFGVLPGFSTGALCVLLFPPISLLPYQHLPVINIFPLLTSVGFQCPSAFNHGILIDPEFRTNPSSLVDSQQIQHCMPQDISPESLGCQQIRNV